ncbi:MAG: hypothetical protein ABSC57_09970 [Syntrophales bacterium]
MAAPKTEVILRIARPTALWSQVALQIHGMTELIENEGSIGRRVAKQPLLNERFMFLRIFE